MIKDCKRSLRKWLKSCNSRRPLWVMMLLFSCSNLMAPWCTVPQLESAVATTVQRGRDCRRCRRNGRVFSPPVSDTSYDGNCEVEDFFAGVLHLSFDDLCGSSGCGTQQRKLGGFLDESKSAACASSAVLKTSSVPPPASPGSRGRLTLHQPPGSLSKGDTHGQRGAAGRAIPPDAKPAWEPARGLFDGKRGPSPTSSVTKEPPRGPSCPQSSSATGRRVSANSRPPPEERLRKRRSLGWPPAPRVQPVNSPKCASRSAIETRGRGESSYDDYFSPNNLKERDSESLLPGVQPPAGPALLHCTRSLSRRERTSLLERADFSCIGRNPRSADGTYSTVKAGFRLQKPANYGADLGLSSVTSKETPAAEGTPGDCPRAEAQRRGDARPGGSDSPHTLDGLTPQKGRRGDFTPLKGSNKEMKGWIDIKSTQKEDTPSKMVNSPEGEALSDYKLNRAGDCDVEKSAEAREELPRGCSESVKRGPTRHDVLDGSWEGFKDLIRPHEESRKREKGQKPTRTLVMTSMPSEYCGLWKWVIGFPRNRSNSQTTSLQLLLAHSAQGLGLREPPAAAVKETPLNPRLLLTAHPVVLGRSSEGRGGRRKDALLYRHVCRLWVLWFSREESSFVRLSDA
ncbi:microcephalin isoform X7 [Balaenoptera musculus]|uniref:Microcephalin isoform X7 n=1 Tax=Balaenoptera musculus TaxID=9771 RepID=A0A8B8WB27_BALMU|nr:microcephalin isoform X7 [Balaenoptera musculus]